MNLHFTHGFKDYDKAWLDANQKTGNRTRWNIPKCAEIGDMVLIVVGGVVYAMAIVISETRYRKDWFRWYRAHRYGAEISGVKLIKPIGFPELRRRWPSLAKGWAKYPRSYTTIKDRNVAFKIMAAAQPI